MARSRWRRADLRAALPWLGEYSPSGVGKALKRLGVRLVRGRLRLHSPDPDHAAKAARAGRALALARARPGRVGLWYGDEAGVHRQPTLAPAWWPAEAAPAAALSCRADTRHRVGGALDAASGRVVRVSGAKVGVAKLRQLLRDLRAADPDRYLFLVWDNWPVHRHPEVLAEAAAQRIRLLWLPTYAPWLNPIEKLWRWLKQDVLRHHRRADDWDGLTAEVAAFLDRFAHPSDDLLRYAGLLPK